MKDSNYKYTNKLIHESSPYLLQHAHNPVNWSAWNQETLENAVSENKLLIISIGYSSCHWCHVMEHESFEDTLVAKIMNEHFIPIKVDREERPDVDDVYMTACNLINGSGGWPLNAIALPDGRPVWAGTYFPKEQWIDILNQFISLKEDNYVKLLNAADQLVAGLQGVDEVIEVSEDQDFKSEDLQLIGERFLKNIDFENGGNLSVQKFPLPNQFDFLLKYAYQYPESDALKAVEVTLDQMASGGIYDQLEGGFSRYTVDSKWKVPHFEKMLYDNAQLLSLYSNAYRKTKDAKYQRIVFETIDFMKRNWKDESGAYYSSYDADSEGEEGKYYTWTWEELKQIIPSDEWDDFVSYFSVKREGNWENKNILHLDPKRTEESREFDKIEKWKDRLLQERQKRTYPGLDDKILCSWNALVLKGYVDAYKAFGDESFREEAISIWKFIEENLLKEGVRLERNYKNGKSSINAFLDDYALCINALIHLYEITFEEDYLKTADKLSEYVLEHFKNKSSSIFNYTSDIDPPLVAKKAEINDGVIPSSNSVMARNLHALGLFLYKEEYIAFAKQMLSNMKSSIETTSQPNFYANWISLYFDIVHDPYEIAILGEEFDEIRREMMIEYHPNALFLGGSEEGSLKLLEDKLQEGDNYIYVCVNKACKLPVQDAGAALKLMN